PGRKRWRSSAPPSSSGSATPAGAPVARGRRGAVSMRGPDTDIDSPQLRQGAAEACVGCGRTRCGHTCYTLDGRSFLLGCALRHRPLLRRSALTSLVVGSVLVAINQGTVIASGSFPPALVWQVPLTYAVPFCVATWGALSNSRRPSRRC